MSRGRGKSFVRRFASNFKEIKTHVRAHPATRFKTRTQTWYGSTLSSSFLLRPPPFCFEESSPKVSAVCSKALQASVLGFTSNGSPPKNAKRTLVMRTRLSLYSASLMHRRHWEKNHFRLRKVGWWCKLRICRSSRPQGFV